MRKTTTAGVIVPYGSVSVGGSALCQGVGAALTTTLSPLVFECTVGSAVTMTTSDQVWLAVGYTITTSPGNKSVIVELAIEGTPGGNYDSRIVVPAPRPPSISSLQPTSGRPGTSVQINGADFGGSQGASLVKFNGVAATPSSWSSTVINAPVPDSATTGPVTVTVGGTASNGVTFTVPPPGPFISSLSPSSAAITQEVTISGTAFGATQGSSTLTFNGVAGTPAQWSDTSIGAPVPAGAATGPVVVTVNGQASNGASLTVLLPQISSLSASNGVAGDPLTISGANFRPSQPSNSGVTFNGIPATVSSWSDTSITVSVPAGATTGSVVVNVGGQASNGVPFTVFTTGTVAGTITRTAGGAALQGATVQAVLIGVIQGSATTAADGTYSIPDIPPGTYDVRVHATGYSSEVRSGTVVAINATTTVNVAMSQPGSISGKVTQSDGVTPVSGAAVTLFLGAIEKASTHTDAAGDYAVSNLHPGAYTVQAVNVGYRTKEQGATILEAANTTSNLTLEPAGTDPIRYAYDELGRLVMVVDRSGDAATYTYDAVGNILAIGRIAAGTVAITEFTPNGAPVGAAVTIFGTGFGATSAENTVTFNGVTATITSSTTTQIVTSVPSGASTGPIGVTAPGGGATTTTNFVVAAASGAPTITGFSPTLALPGTTLTISGTNFDPVAANNRVTLNVAFATVTTNTATSIPTSIPGAATSGRVTVTTPEGTAVGADDLFVVPPGYATADVAVTTRMTFGEAAQIQVSLPVASRIALVLFDGEQGRRAAVKVSGSTIGTGLLKILAPNGLLVTSLNFDTSTRVTNAAPLSQKGTYTILVDPAGTATGDATLTLYDVPPDPTSPIGFGPASSVVASTTVPSQNARLTFTGAVGQKVSITGTDKTIPSLDMYLQAPDGTRAASAGGLSGTFIDATTLTLAGTYSIVIDPVGVSTGDIRVTLYDVVDLTGTVTPDDDGEVLNLDITTPGQRALYTFSGAQDRRFAMEIAPGPLGGVRLLNPDGTLLAAQSIGVLRSFMDVRVLPATGTYTIVADPDFASTGTVTLKVFDVPPDLAGTAAINDVEQQVSIATPGQNASFTFGGTESQAVRVLVTNNTYASTTLGGCVAVKLLQGTTELKSVSSCSATFELSSQTLPATGTYTLVIDPQSNATGSLRFRVVSP